MPALFDYICRDCRLLMSIEGLKGATCKKCGKKMTLKPFKMRISIPTEQTKAVAEEENVWDQTMSEEEKKKKAEEDAIFRSDEHWQNEWHAAELHGPNDGGQALADERAATR